MIVDALLLAGSIKRNKVALMVGLILSGIVILGLVVLTLMSVCGIFHVIVIAFTLPTIGFRLWTFLIGVQCYRSIGVGTLPQFKLLENWNEILSNWYWLDCWIKNYLRNLLKLDASGCSIQNILRIPNVLIRQYAGYRRFHVIKIHDTHSEIRCKTVNESTWVKCIILPVVMTIISRLQKSTTLSFWWSKASCSFLA